MVSPKKDLIADGAGASHGQNVLGVGLDDNASNAEVHQRFRFAELFLDFYLFCVGRGRNRVRHIDNGRDAAAHRCGRPGLKVFLVGHAGFAEMHMAIEDAGQNMLALGVDFFLALRQLIVGADGDNFLVALWQRRPETFPWVLPPNRF